MNDREREQQEEALFQAALLIHAEQLGAEDEQTPSDGEVPKPSAKARRKFRKKVLDGQKDSVLPRILGSAAAVLFLAVCGYTLLCVAVEPIRVETLRVLSDFLPIESKSQYKLAETGDEFDLGGLRYRWKTARAMTDFQGDEWLSLSRYEEWAEHTRKRFPDFEPAVVIVTMDILHQQDFAREFNMHMFLYGLNEDDSLTEPHEPLAYDLRPYEYIESYLHYTFEPNEEVTANFYYIADKNRLDQPFVIELTGGNTVQNVQFRVNTIE